MQNHYKCMENTVFARYSMLWERFSISSKDYEPFCFYFIVWKIVIYKPKNDMANFSIVVVPTKNYQMADIE